MRDSISGRAFAVIGWPNYFSGGAHMTYSVRGAVFLAVTLSIILLRLGGQEQNLLPHLSPDVLALYAAHSAFINPGNLFDPLFELNSPDAGKTKILDEAESSAADYLRAAADLVAIYENLQSEADRSIVKPLLIDRLRLYSRLLGIDAERAALPLGQANKPATTKRALKLRDDILAAKNKVDAIAASL
jgi:hypothetical protein